jgi:hypothetical protein
MNGLAERLERCDREIECAIAESKRPHTPMEHTGILLWEMDWRLERENILREMVSITPAADRVLEIELNYRIQSKIEI